MYQTVAARRMSYDSMSWQVPGMSLTAQAFLMTIGLSPEAGRLARIAVGCLAIVISLMSVQALLRHRRTELADSIWLSNAERAFGWEGIHDAADDRAVRLGVATPRLARGRSTRIWMAGLLAFGVVGLAVAINALIG